MSERDHEAGEEESRHRRGLEFRRRDDYAVELFQEARTNLGDVARVDRILLELGRFYNPYINAAIVDLDTRRQILERLAAGDQEEAARLLEHRLALYSRAPGTSD